MVSIGLVGHGAWGQYIQRDLLKLEAEVFVADIDPEARELALKDGAAAVFHKTDDLPICDGYVVAVPIPQLTPVSALLLERKKPVFCEKTLLLSEDDFQKLKDLGGTELIFAMHKWHYHPGIEALRILIQNKRLGEIRQISTIRHHWVPDFHGGDVFWTQGVHDLTIVKHLLGYIPAKISAIHVVRNRANLPVSFEAILGDNPFVSMSVSGAHCYKRSGVTIHGDKGTAGLHNAYDDHITIRDIKGEENIPIDTTFPLYLELKNFLDYLEGGSRPLYDLYSAYEITKTIIHLRQNAGIS